MSNANRLRAILSQGQLRAVYQPIYDFQTQQFFGYEGFIRGPEGEAGSGLQSPFELFGAARLAELSAQLNQVCVPVVLRGFAALELPGNVFVNMSPQTVLDQRFDPQRAAQFMADLGLSAARVTVELTEEAPTYDFAAMRLALERYRANGHSVAIDDLGEGFASLRLWSELQPHFVKADKHFVTGAALDPVKSNFLRAIQQLASHSTTQVIAEGIETLDDFKWVRELGIRYGQGYFFAHPSANPPRAPSAAVLAAAHDRRVSVMAFPVRGSKPHSPGVGVVTPRNDRLARDIAHPVLPVSRDCLVADVLARFAADPHLLQLPVVDDGQLTGLIRREFLAELVQVSAANGVNLSPQTCGMIMSAPPVAVDANLDLAALGSLLGESEGARFGDGFAVLVEGRYLGFGYTQELLREINGAHQNARRHVNLLSGLPGQVPLNEHLVRLVNAELPFTVWYCEINQLRGLNDQIGFEAGDQLLAIAAQCLVDAGLAGQDFFGHVSGSRVVALIQSTDWQARVSQVINTFEARLGELIPGEVLARGHFVWKSRQGEPEQRPLPRLSIGVLEARPGEYETRHEVLSRAKKMAEAAKLAPSSAWRLWADE